MISIGLSARRKQPIIEPQKGHARNAVGCYNHRIAAAFLGEMIFERKSMTESIYRATIISAAAVFTLLFAVWCIPPMIANPDVIGAFAAGFVNPYASGYAADTLSCWVILAAWIVYEARTKNVRHGWMFVLLGMVPGVAVGFAGYLLVRRGQVGE